MSKTFIKAKERQDYLFNEMSALLNILASPVRLKIIHFLAQAPHSVEQLSLKLGQSIANTSMHLKKMQRENILHAEISGQKRIYSLAQVEMKDFWEQIQDFARIHNAANIISSEEIYSEDLNWEKGLEETVKMLKAKKLFLLDVRPSDEVLETDSNYEKYVIHVPFEDLKKMQDKIPTSKPVLVICRGRLCVISNESTFLLRKIGIDAYKFDYSWFQITKYFD